MASSGWGVNTSGVHTANFQVCTRPALLHGLVVTPPTVGVATLVMYDNAGSSATGKVLLKLQVDAGEASINYALPHAVNVDNGIYCVLTGPGASEDYLVYWSSM